MWGWVGKQEGVALALSHLFIEKLAGVLLDEVQVLHLAGREAHQQGNGLCGGRELVEVVAGGLGPLVDALVDGLVEVNGLEPCVGRELAGESRERTERKLRSGKPPRGSRANLEGSGQEAGEGQATTD